MIFDKLLKRVSYGLLGLQILLIIGKLTVLGWSWPWIFAPILVLFALVVLAIIVVAAAFNRG